jgi:cytochrome c peroxidase
VASRYRTACAPRHGLSKERNRRGQEAGRARPDALRPRLRSPGPPHARVSTGDLSHHPAGPRRRLPGEARHGVACLDCHSNGSTNGAAHLVGDQRPQWFRRRIETPALRGLYAQRSFGSQRALTTVEDFTEFEQRAAYFDGDPVIATKKGVNILERGSQVHFMAEMQKIFDFPPAPKLRVADGRLDPSKATPAELRGQDVFFGKGQCASCHTAPFYTDNTMHDLKLERFYKQEMVNGEVMNGDGPIKTLALRGVKDTPPYMHDGRLLTLDDTVEFFNIVLETKLTDTEKKDLVAFMRTL